MKTITATRRSHPATFKKCKSLGQLISVLEKEGENQKLFVVSVSLNGKKMDEEEEKLLDSLSINDIEALEIELKTMGEIVRDSITNIISSIQDTQLRAISFCRSFRKDNLVDDEKVKFTLIQCRSIIDSLEEIFLAHTNKQFQVKHHSLWLESEKELTNILQCILQGRRLSDVNFLADLIEYDLVQALDQWEEVLEKELVDNPAFSGIFSLNNSWQKSDNGVDA